MSWVLQGLGLGAVRHQGKGSKEGPRRKAGPGVGLGWGSQGKA